MERGRERKIGFGSRWKKAAQVVLVVRETEASIQPAGMSSNMILNIQHVRFYVMKMSKTN